ncbi:MAG: Crp/Fnr family transcriptional regulator [Chthoniobacterales bacterium]|nr:MAG: Crp/Fnr family transcriptional regulator [Chthoniobacterales bacterium]
MQRNFSRDQIACARYGSVVALDTSQFKQAVIENTLRSCQLFVGLPGADIQAVASFVVLKHLGKGDYLFREGDRSAGFYIVQKGAVNIHRVSGTGKEQVIHVFRPVESFAEATLATDGGYPAEARAIEPTTVLLVPKTDFIELLRKVPGLALRMLGAMSQHLRVLVGLLDDLTLKDMETRLASWLVKRCPRPLTNQPVTVQLDRTKRVLASEMGTTSETLSRTLAKFRDQRLLRVTGNSITILQPSELEKALQRHLER